MVYSPQIQFHRSLLTSLPSCPPAISSPTLYQGRGKKHNYVKIRNAKGKQTQRKRASPQERVCMPLGTKSKKVAPPPNHLRITAYTLGSPRQKQSIHIETNDKSPSSPADQGNKRESSHPLQWMKPHHKQHFPSFLSEIAFALLPTMKEISLPK